MAKETYRFTLTPQDSTLDERRVQEILESAIAEAIADATKDGYEVEAQTELPGGFGGLGEIAAVMVFLAKSGAVAKLVAAAQTGATVAAKGLVEGASGAAGKFFFDKYVKPRLIKKNALPSEIQNGSPSATTKVPVKGKNKAKGKRG
jgi:hypothetical protein